MTGDHADPIGSALVVKPGDRLIIGLASRNTPQDFDRIVNIIKERLPDVDVLIVDQVSTMAVVRNPSATD